MSWSIGYDTRWARDIGYGVPAICDHPECDKKIHRGLAYVCGGEPHGGDEGCGLFFCGKHRHGEFCVRCIEGADPFDAKPDTEEWTRHKLTDPSWAERRRERGI